MKAGVPNGIRTRVAGVKGRCPRPLDDGDVANLRSGLDIAAGRGEIKSCCHDVPIKRLEVRGIIDDKLHTIAPLPGISPQFAS